MPWRSWKREDRVIFLPCEYLCPHCCCKINQFPTCRAWTFCHGSWRPTLMLKVPPLALPTDTKSLPHKALGPVGPAVKHRVKASAVLGVNNTWVDFGKVWLCLISIKTWLSLGKHWGRLVLVMHKIYMDGIWNCHMTLENDAIGLFFYCRCIKILCVNPYCQKVPSVSTCAAKGRDKTLFLDVLSMRTGWQNTVKLQHWVLAVRSCFQYSNVRY